MQVSYTNTGKHLTRARHTPDTHTYISFISSFSFSFSSPAHIVRLWAIRSHIQQSEKKCRWRKEENERKGKNNRRLLQRKKHTTTLTKWGKNEMKTVDEMEEQEKERGSSLLTQIHAHTHTHTKHTAVVLAD